MLGLFDSFGPLSQKQRVALEHVGAQVDLEDMLEAAHDAIEKSCEGEGRFAVWAVMLAKMKSPNPDLVDRAVRAVFEVAKRERE